MILTFGKYVHLLQGMVHFLKLGLLTTTDSGIGCCPPAPPRLASWKQSSPLPPAEVLFETLSTVEMPQRWPLMDTAALSPVPIFFLRITGFVSIGAPRAHGGSARPSYRLLRG